MINIFENQNPIDESNFLDFEIKKLRSANSLVDYRNAIDNLDDIHSVLSIIKNVNRIHEIAHRTYYMDALRWLKGELAINNWHYVPIAPDLTTLTSDVAASFNSYVAQLRQSLQAEPLYAQTELAMQVAPLVKIRPITKSVEITAEVAKDDILSAAAIQKGEIESTANGLQSRLQEDADQARINNENILRSVIDGSFAEIDQRAQNAISQVRQATALKEWGEVYDQYIDELTLRLNGGSLENALTRNVSVLISKFRSLYVLGLRNINWLKLPFTVIYLLGKNIISLIKIFGSKLNSISGQRTISFLLLAITALLLAGLPLVALLTNSESLRFFKPTEPIQWLVKASIWLPIVVIFSLSYSFAAKNYRIYANMLDQYKHRKSVAKTAQGIILSIDPSSADNDLRNAMTAAAASALFEHKVTGHLSKKEVESLGLLDVIRTISSKS